MEVRDVQRVVPVVVIQFIQRVHEPEEYGLGRWLLLHRFPGRWLFPIQYTQTDFGSMALFCGFLPALRLCGHVTFHFVPVIPSKASLFQSFQVFFGIVAYWFLNTIGQHGTCRRYVSQSQTVQQCAHGGGIDAECQGNDAGSEEQYLAADVLRNSRGYKIPSGPRSWPMHRATLPGKDNWSAFGQSVSQAFHHRVKQHNHGKADKVKGDVDKYQHA